MSESQSGEPTNNGCPITADFLPETMKKHVAPNSPVPLRMMAAKGLVPLAASDLAQVFFMLTYDADPSVAEAALKSAQELPDRIASSAFRDEEVEPATLSWYLGLLGLKSPGYAEMLILNSSTPDAAVAALAAQCGRATATIIGANQLRILRDTEIIRQLALNPEAQGALIDGVCDFAVRSGVKLQDVPEMAAAAVRLFGANADAELEKDKETADALLKEMESPASAVVVHNLYQRVQTLSVVQRMRLAAKGNKECRDLLLRDPNRLVAVSAMRNPAMTEGEVLTQAANRLAFAEVIRVILTNRDWMRKYPVRLALAKNPKVPQGHALRILNSLREADLKSLGRDRNVPGAIQAVARKISAAKKY